MITLSQNVFIAVNSHTRYIWVVNVITDSNTCLLSVSGVSRFIPL